MRSKKTNKQNMLLIKNTIGLNTFNSFVRIQEFIVLHIGISINAQLKFNDIAHARDMHIES